MPARIFKTGEFEVLYAAAHLGDKTAQGELLERHQRGLLAQAARYLGPKLKQKTSAEDLVQEAFVSALPLFAQPAVCKALEFAAKLYKVLDSVARNEVRSYCKTAKRDVNREVPDEHDGEEESGTEGLVDFRELPAGWDTEAGEMVDAVTFEWSRLPTAEMHLLHLRFERKWSFPQIGIEVGCSSEAARKRVDRAVIHIRVAVLRQWGDFASGASFHPPGPAAREWLKCFDS